MSKLDTKVDTLCHQLCQKDMCNADLWKTFSVQKIEQKVTDENMISTLEKEYSIGLNYEE